MLPDDGVIKAPHVLVTIALPTDGQGLDDVHGRFTMGVLAYVKTATLEPVEFIGVVTACTIENDERPNR
jgi:hypothetical protein